MSDQYLISVYSNATKQLDQVITKHWNLFVAIISLDEKLNMFDVRRRSGCI